MIVNEGVFEFTNGLQVSSRGSLLAAKRRKEELVQLFIQGLGST